MAKLGKEQVKVAKGMVGRASIRQIARQLGVTEGALRYRLRREADDGRRKKPSLVDGYEEAITAILELLGDGRLTGGERPAPAKVVYTQLVRDCGFTGSYRSVVRHLRRCFGVAPVRALRRVETPPGVQAQHDWFEEACNVGGQRCMMYFLTGTLSHSRGRFALGQPGDDAVGLAHGPSRSLRPLRWRPAVGADQPPEDGRNAQRPSPAAERVLSGLRSGVRLRRGRLPGAPAE